MTTSLHNFTIGAKLNASNFINLDRFETINQTNAHSNTSEKYSFIPTKQVLDVFADYGFFPAKIQESRTRKVENAGFQKHIVKLRKQDICVGDEYPEIILVNSHLGSAAFELSLGMFRLLCSNGLAAPVSTFAAHKIRHTGYTNDMVATAIESISQGIPLLTQSVEKFKSIELSSAESKIFAESAIDLAYDGETWNVNPESVLGARRWDDKKTDLWTTFNRVQENVIKGGVRARNNEGRNRRTRAVTSIDNNLKLNRSLWSLAEKMAELKQ